MNLPASKSKRGWQFVRNSLLRLSQIIIKRKNMLSELLERRADWLERGKFFSKMPIEKHLRYEYFPTYYEVLADYDRKIAQAYRLENMEDDVKLVESKVNYY